MSIMELGAIGELVGGVAVIGTLFYLARQIQHSVALARSSQQYGLMDTYARLNELCASDPPTRALLARLEEPGAELSPEEVVGARHFAYRMCNIYISTQVAFDSRQIGEEEIDFYEHDLKQWTTQYPGLKVAMQRVMVLYPQTKDWRVFRSLHQSTTTTE